MQRPDGRLHREGNREGNKEPDRHAVAHRRGRQRTVGKRQRTLGLVLVQEAEVQDASEEEDRAGEGIDEELHRGLSALGPAPHRDNEVGRHQGEFEENEKLQEVVRDEATHGERGQQQQPRNELTLTALIARAQEREQQH